MTEQNWKAGAPAAANLRSAARGDQAGATAVEYAIMLVLIAVVIFVAVAAIGLATNDALCGPVPALGGDEGDC